MNTNQLYIKKTPVLSTNGMKIFKLSLIALGLCFFANAYSSDDGVWVTVYQKSVFSEFIGSNGLYSDKEHPVYIHAYDYPDGMNSSLEMPMWPGSPIRWSKRVNGSYYVPYEIVLKQHGIEVCKVVNLRNRSHQVGFTLNEIEVNLTEEVDKTHENEKAKFKCTVWLYYTDGMRMELLGVKSTKLVLNVSEYYKELRSRAFMP